MADRECLPFHSETLNAKIIGLLQMACCEDPAGGHHWVPSSTQFQLLLGLLAILSGAQVRHSPLWACGSQNLINI